MTTKYNLGDTIYTNDPNGNIRFKGVISMITINKKGTRYRAYGSCRISDTFTINQTQNDIWEEDIVGVMNEN